MDTGIQQKKYHKYASKLSVYLICIITKTNDGTVVHRILVAKKRGAI